MVLKSSQPHLQAFTNHHTNFKAQGMRKTEFNRTDLTNELHARPALPLDGEMNVHHLAFMGGMDEGQKAGTDLFDQMGIILPSGGMRHQTITHRDVLIKWEQHTEFFTVTVHEPANETMFGRCKTLPTQWIDELEDHRVVDMRLCLRKSNDMEHGLPTKFQTIFDLSSLCGVSVAKNVATYFTDFRLHGSDLATHHLVLDHGMSAFQAGRNVLRIVEIETYRVMAMIGYQHARQIAPELADAERRLVRLTELMGREEDAKEARELLDEVTELSATTEKLNAGSSFRFGASRAYSSIVMERIGSLREERLMTYRSLTGFMDRRFMPSIRTIESYHDRIDKLAERLGRTANLLRTRVDVNLEEQNSKLLQSMEKRAGLQLRLQQTVEGLSVIAISYYAVSLFGYLAIPIAKNTYLDPKILTGFAAIPILLLVILLTRRVRKRLER